MININFKVTENEVTKLNQVGDSTTGSIGQIKCTFDLDPVYTDLTCIAVFNDIKIPMIRGVCYADNIPEGRCVVGVYAYSETNGTVDKRISPKPCVIVVDKGSYLEGHDPEPPTASETERFYNLINEAISSGQIKGDKGEKGDKGDKGDPYELTISDIWKIVDNIPYASVQTAGILQVPGGCGLLVDNRGNANVYYNIPDITSTTDDIIVDKQGGTLQGDGYCKLTFNSTKYAQKSEVPTKTSDLQNDSGYITADDVPFEVYVGSEEPQGNEVIWVDDSTTPENIYATKAYVDEVVNLSKTRIVTNTKNAVIPAFELANNTEYRFTLELESVEFTLPENPTDDFISSLVFKSGATATTITYPDTIKWSGDDISSDKFVPASSKTYEVLIYWNGINFCGIVKGW